MKATMVWRCRACDGFGERLLIIIVNLIPPDHVDDVPVVEPNQHDDVPVVPEPVLVDEDEDPKEEKFQEEEEPQEEEEEDDMEVNIEEDENEPELTYPYEEVDPLNPPPPASDSKSEDVIEVEDTIESEDETVPASVHEVGELSTAPFLREDSDGLLPGLMRKDINSFFVRTSVEQGTAAMDNLKKKLRDLCLKKITNSAFDVWFKMRKNHHLSRRGSPREILANYASKVCTFDSSCCWRMIKESVDAAIAAERVRHENTRNDARGSRPVREGKKVKFDAATLQGPALTWWNSKVATMGLETVNRMP
ncbi:hypothetical protein Tco_0888461 [Tanacetum coccineum]